MQYPDDLTGHLLVAIPKTAHTAYVRGVMLVTSHYSAGAASCLINRPMKSPSFSVGQIMATSGVDFDSKAPVFEGGPDEPNRVQFVHSLDWQCPSTKILSKEIGVTQEVSILTAISKGEGPEHWRCVVGDRISGAGHLEGELAGQDPWIPGHRWLVIPATVDTVFGSIGDQQWIESIAKASQLETATWL